MISSAFEQLAPEQKKLVDAAVLCVESRHVERGYFYSDTREDDIDFTYMLPPADRALMLRSLFAVDIRTNPPRYFDWKHEGAALVESAVKIRNEVVMKGSAAAQQLAPMVQHLTSLQPVHKPAVELKRFDELRPVQKELIDAYVFATELSTRRGTTLGEHDDRHSDGSPDAQTRVELLRGLYALDIQSDESSYAAAWNNANWRRGMLKGVSDAINSGIAEQKHFQFLQPYMALLTNLPDPKQRGGR